MPRNLSTTAKAYTGPMLWLLELTTPAGNAYFFAEDAVNFAGQSYLPYLALTSGPRSNRSLQPDDAEVTLLNADLAVGALLAADPFEGALCELSQLLLGLEQKVLILRGRLTEQEETDLGVKFRLVSELDPAQIDLPARLYSQLCTWRFRQPPCGYLPDQQTLALMLAEQAADVFSATTIGNTALGMTVNEHRDRLVVLTAGTGRGQKRVIDSNSATTLTLRGQWATTPDATSRFKVYSVSAGAPKVLFQAGTGVLEQPADIFSARTIGASALLMTTDEHADALVVIAAGAGAGQQREIGSNSAATLTLDDAEPDFNPLPDATSVFRVAFRSCPKDFAPSCEDRGRTQSFNGFPTLVPLSRRNFGGRFGPGGLPGGGGFGEAGRGRGHGPRPVQLY